MNLILSHDHTDFDAVAAQLGAWKLHPGWVPVLGRYLNRNVRTFLTLHWAGLPFRRDEELPAGLAIERAILVDTQSLPSLKGIDTQAIPEVLVVDHHAQREDTPDGWDLRLDTTGSCATLFVEEIAERHLSLSWIEATLLLLGIHEDTGSLVYAGATPRDARAAAWLMQQGADLDTLRRYLDHPLTDRQRDLYRRLLEGSDFLEINGFQIVVASAAMDSYVEDVSSLAHSIRDLYDPAALVLVVEMGDHVQMVARSTSDDIDVGELMKTFDGGGHSRAAAAFVDAEPLAKVVARLKQRLPAHVRPAVTVADWMSRGRIRSLAPRSKIEEAAALMRRWGHEGFPVIDESGDVVGVLTRRDVD
ncbi:MAG: CBS domain-containing protein, partial [Geodermatophilaceae bacterium]|nr:CBS domain-containing protein [Geodermatophilaceae bacterium]